MPRVLLTSFEPFGGHDTNASLEVARVLEQSPPAGVAIDWLIVPVVAHFCVEQAWSQITASRPAFVLALGQAGSSPRLRLEDRGINFDHFAFPDNGGHCPQQQAIVPGAPGIYRTRVPLHEVIAQLQREGQPVEPSFSAGSYVCNHFYYQLLHRAAQDADSPPILFVHLPLLPAQLRDSRRAFAMPLLEQVTCVRAILRACCLGEPGA
jgi:pyroglutamyl-peptidase